MSDKFLQRRFDTLGPEQIDIEILESVPYQYSGRRTDVEIIYPEFTSVCPWTGLPDFGTIKILYIPEQLCIEFKALKYYLTSFRNVGILQEHVPNRILDDLVKVIQPRTMTVYGDFNARGGMRTLVSASFGGTGKADNF